MPMTSPTMFSTSKIIRRLERRSPISLPLRFASSHQSQTPAPKVISPHIGFYKTFGRPIAKVLLMATLAYQFTYWAWVKLEKDEIRTERQAEIAGLEAELNDTIARKKGP